MTDVDKGYVIRAIMCLVLIVVLVLLATGINAMDNSEPGCVKVGSAGDEVLYLCETDYGVRCVWDPSPVLGAGVMDCEW